MAAIGGLFSWVVREHCVRYPDAVTKAWEQLSVDAPTLADAGRMFAAYGVDFTVAELRYIATHPEALFLIRAVAAGRDHVQFHEGHGFVAASGFLPPARGRVGIAAWVLMFATVACFLGGAGAGVSGNLRLTALFGVLTVVSFFLNLVEFADQRSRHRARRAIDMCKTSNVSAEAQPTDDGQPTSVDPVSTLVSEHASLCAGELT